MVSFEMEAFSTTVPRALQFAISYAIKFLLSKPEFEPN